MKDPQHRLAVAFGIAVESAEGLGAVEFLRGDFPDGGFTFI